MAPPQSSPTLRSSLSKSSGSSLASTPTRLSSTTSGGITHSGSLPCLRSTAPPFCSSERQPLSSQGIPLAGDRGRRPSRAHFRHLRLDALAGVPVRPRSPLSALQGRCGLRQGYPPQADLLRLPYARTGLLAGGDHPHLGGSSQRPRALGSLRTCRIHLRDRRRRP